MEQPNTEIQTPPQPVNNLPLSPQPLTTQQSENSFPLFKLALIFMGILLSFSLLYLGYQFSQSRKTTISCGGIAGLKCPPGYNCKLEGNFPDAMGTCIKPLFGEKIILSPTPTVNPPISGSAPDPTVNWKSYALKTLNLSFKLPPSFSAFGELQEDVAPGEKGTYLCVTFPRNKITFIKSVFAGGFGCSINKFGLGTTSVDFEAGREAGFADLQGYTFENGKYYAKLLGKKFDIPNDLVKKIDNPNGITMIRIIGKNSTDEDWQGPLAGTPGEGNIGALINTGNSLYPGLAVQMEINKDLTEDIFDQILGTFKFLDQPKTDETANWKTYADQLLNISIKYPDNISILRSIPGDMVTFSQEKDSKKDFRAITTLDIYVRGKPGTTPEQALIGECATREGETCQEKFENITINNATGIKTLGPNYPYEDNYYLTSKTGKSSVVRLFVFPKGDNPNEGLETLRRMVKTFKFTN